MGSGLRPRRAGWRASNLCVNAAVRVTPHALCSGTVGFRLGCQLLLLTDCSRDKHVAELDGMIRPRSGPGHRSSLGDKPVHRRHRRHFLVSPSKLPWPDQRLSHAVSNTRMAVDKSLDATKPDTQSPAAVPEPSLSPVFPDLKCKNLGNLKPRRKRPELGFGCLPSALWRPAARQHGT